VRQDSLGQFITVPCDSVPEEKLSNVGAPIVPEDGRNCFVESSSTKNYQLTANFFKVLVPGKTNRWSHHSVPIDTSQMATLYNT
jgi:hypothetical protein